MRTQSFTRLLLVALVMVFFAIVTSSTALANGNDFVFGELRVDPPDIPGARDYEVDLLATSGPSQSPGGSFTTAWLSLNLDHLGPGTFPDKFTQVGLLTDQTAIYWFMYSEAGVTCLRGNIAYTDPIIGTLGCKGDPNDLVAINVWHTVELVKYVGQDYWIARVYDTSGAAYDVAQINAVGNNIYRANSVTEAAFTGDTDPNMEANFYHNHPRYWSFNTNGFNLWPPSTDTNYSYIWTTAINRPLPICPNLYGATLNIDFDYYKWFAGTGGQICSGSLFHISYDFLPLIDN